LWAANDAAFQDYSNVASKVRKFGNARMLTAAKVAFQRKFLIASAEIPTPTDGDVSHFPSVIAGGIFREKLGEARPQYFRFQKIH
jgi:hypothetical protein